MHSAEIEDSEEDENDVESEYYYYNYDPSYSFDPENYGDYFDEFGKK